MQTFNFVRIPQVILLSLFLAMTLTIVAACDSGDGGAGSNGIEQGVGGENADDGTGE